jgi:hypothetical protein
MRSRPVSRGHPQPFQPCIAELLRTCVYPSTLLLRVEKILEEDGEEAQPEGSQAQDTKTNGTRNTTYKLYLGDGELMVQALLAPQLHPLIRLQETTEGSLIELREYTFRKARRRSGKGEVIYVAVDDYVCMTLSRPTTSEARKEITANGGGFVVEEERPATRDRSPAHIQVPSSPPIGEMPQDISSSQESCEYETIIVDQETVNKRRQALHELSSNSQAKRRREAEEDITPPKRFKPDTEVLASFHNTTPVDVISGDQETLTRQRLASPNPNIDSVMRGKRNDESAPTKSSTYQAGKDANAQSTSRVPHNANSTINQAPLPPSAPHHTLHSLLHPPIPLPPRNYPVTILAVISWISPTTLHQPGSPFPPKRTLKLHDPSITDRQVGVSISVFIDAASFTPRHGTVALFRGVVMQMWRDEVILNAYPSLRGTKWYVEDGRELEGMGYDVRGMRAWWEERRRGRRNVAAAAVAGSGKGGSGGGV